MIRNFIFFLLSIILVIVECQNDYDNYMSIDFSLIDKENITTSQGKNEDLGKCRCDLTENSCDYLCCCDTDCSSATLSLWSNTTNACSNLVSKISSSKTMCFNNNILYNYNRKRGMNEFNSLGRNLFCVNFDDSSIMNEFYKIVQNLNNSTMTSYISTVSDPKWKYITTNNSVFNIKDTKLFYLWNDIISLYNITKTSGFDLYYLVKSVGPYGECVKNSVVRFWKNIPLFTCKNIINPMENCLDNSWENEILIRIAGNPSGTSWIGVTLSTLFVKNMTTGELTDITGSYRFSSINQTNNTCICYNLLLEAHIKAVIDPISYILLYFYVDVVIADSMSAECTGKYEYENKYSYTFVTSKEDLIRSGNPGYSVGSILQVANLKNGYFVLRKYGFFINARNTKGICLQSNNYLNSFEYSLKFGEDLAYTCQQKFSSSNDFNNFCTSQLWKNLKIFDVISNIEYIGIMGNADPSNPNHWLKVLTNYNFSNSTFSNNICNFPNIIVLDIMYSKAGIKANPQKYIVSAKISSFNNNFSFNTSVDIRFIVNYIDLDIDLYSKPLPTPSILPRLPTDIADPFVKG